MGGFLEHGTLYTNNNKRYTTKDPVDSDRMIHATALHKLVVGLFLNHKPREKKKQPKHGTWLKRDGEKGNCITLSPSKTIACGHVNCIMSAGGKVTTFFSSFTSSCLIIISIRIYLHRCMAQNANEEQETRETLKETRAK